MNYRTQVLVATTLVSIGCTAQVEPIGGITLEATGPTEVLRGEAVLLSGTLRGAEAEEWTGRAADKNSKQIRRRYATRSPDGKPRVAVNFRPAGTQDWPELPETGASQNFRHHQPSKST